MDEETRSTLLRVVTAVMQREESQKYFNEPFNSSERSGYAICVQRPMDLGTIQRNLQLPPGESPYSSAAAVLQDVQLVWENCAAFFPAGHEARVAADTLSGTFTQMHQAAQQQQQQQQFRMQSFQQQQLLLQKQQAHFALQNNSHNQQQQQTTLGHPPSHPMQPSLQPFQHAPQPPQTFMFVPVDNAPPSQLGGHQPSPAPAAVSSAAAAAPPPPPQPAPGGGGSGGAAAPGSSAAHPSAAAMAPGPPPNGATASSEAAARIVHPAGGPKLKISLP
ncbi:hypothetical protein Vretimale_14327, partial [Volvox reticuliferus]